jgi:peroxiredoxin Q/BCP
MPEKKAALDRKVPAFALPSTGTGKWKLADAAGRNLVVYFYPKDATSGCTMEGEAFRDLHAKFSKARTEIVGVSPTALPRTRNSRRNTASPSNCLRIRKRKSAHCSGSGRKKACTAGSIWASNAAHS